MPMADTAQLAVRLTLDDRQFSGALSRTNTRLSNFGRSFAKIGSGVGKVGTGIVRAAERIAVVAGAGFIAAAKAGATFEAQMNTINTIAQEQGTAFEGPLGEIGDGIRKLAITGGADLGDLTSGYYDLLSAGIAAKDAQGVLTKAWELGRGALGTTWEGVDVLTTAINSYADSGLYAGKTTGQLATLFADQLAKAVELGKVKLTDIGTTFADVAPLAAQAGIGLDQIAAAYGTITAKGSAAGEVSTQMSRAIIELLKPGKDLEDLQKKLGKNYAELARKKGLVPALQQLREDAEKSGIPFQDLFGRLEGLRFVLNTTGVNFENFEDVLAAVRDSAGTLADQVSARNKGLAFAVQKLGAGAREAGILLSEGFTGSLERLADKASAFLLDEKTRSAIRGFGEDIGKAIDGINWSAVLEGAKEFVGLLKGAAGVAVEILKALNTLPAPVKEAGLGLFALNKLSGGLIAGGLGDILSGVGGGLLRGILSKVPVVGALAATPVFVTNWPGGLGGGLGPAGAVGGAAGGLGLGAAVGIAGLGALTAFVVTSALDAWTKQNRINAGRDPNERPISLDERRLALMGRTAHVTGDQPATQSHNAYLAAQTVAAIRAASNVTSNKLEANRIAMSTQNAVSRAAEAAHAAQQRMAIDRVRHAVAVQPVPQVTVNVRTSITGGAVKKSLDTLTTWVSGRQINAQGQGLS